MAEGHPKGFPGWQLIQPSPSKRPMTSLTVALLSFLCLCTGIGLGLLLQGMLPGHHLGSDS